MAIIRHSISNVLLIVAFLVLAAIASLVYSGDAGQKEKIIDNAWYQKAQSGIGAILYFSTALADMNLKKNIGFGQSLKEKLISSDQEDVLDKGKTIDSTASGGTDSQIAYSETALPETSSIDQSGEDFPEALASSSEPEDGFWDRAKRLFQEEWQQSQENKGKNSDDSQPLGNWFDYQKTEQGAEIIFRPLDGEEYKLPLPFGFLKR